MKHFLKLLDCTTEEIVGMLNLADQLKYELKHGIPHRHLEGKSLGMIFEKASTRTRVSFEVGMYQLGGHPLFLSSKDLQIGRGEPVQDTARVLSRFLDGIMIRTFEQAEVEALAEYGSIPVINGLTDFCHPCQIMADLMTIREFKGKLEGLKMCFIGDGNNMMNSLIVGALKTGMSIDVACPEGYEPPKEILDFAAEYGDKFHMYRNPMDAAKDAENIPKVRAVNAAGTQHIADACKQLGCRMIYISTDYVFSGQGTEPWTPDCKDFAPLNIYGQTKLEGELAVANTLDKFFIVRIAWVFGKNGNNFIKTMLNVGKKHDTIRVVNDQIGTPTYTYDLARLLADMAESEKYGYYHATNEGGYISWYDFACEIFRQAGMDVRVQPVSTAEYGLSKAARPFNSRLDKSKLLEKGFVPLPDWRDALQRYMKEIETEG